MKSQRRASMTALLLALHSSLVHCMAQPKALVMEDYGGDDALHRDMYGAAARRNLASLSLRQDPSLSLAQQRRLLEYVVPMVEARHVCNPLRSCRRTRSICELEVPYRVILCKSDGQGHLSVVRSEIRSLCFIFSWVCCPFPPISLHPYPRFPTPPDRHCIPLL